MPQGHRQQQTLEPDIVADGQMIELQPLRGSECHTSTEGGKPYQQADQVVTDKDVFLIEGEQTSVTSPDTILTGVQCSDINEHIPAD